jgi:hypothetical protein
MGRGWGLNGSEHDEFGVLPDIKEVKMGGYEPVKMVTNLSNQDIKSIILDSVTRTGKVPTQIEHEGARCSKGLIIKGIGFVCVDLVPREMEAVK